MATRNYFSHDSPEGLASWDRAAAAGYGRYVGENIALGYKDVPDIMSGWMSSPGHRANILGTQYTDIGVGFAYGWTDLGDGGSYQPYWTEVFGAHGSC
jgi:uncharacterized protein YkwD